MHTYKGCSLVPFSMRDPNLKEFSQSKHTRFSGWVVLRCRLKGYSSEPLYSTHMAHCPHISHGTLALTNATFAWGPEVDDDMPSAVEKDASLHISHQTKGFCG